MPRSRLQAVAATKEELVQEVGVYPGQLIEAREESVHNTGAQLQLIQHALTEQPLHDVQGLHVAHLRLNQFCQGQPTFRTFCWLVDEHGSEQGGTSSPKPTGNPSFCRDSQPQPPGGGRSTSSQGRRRVPPELPEIHPTPVSKGDLPAWKVGLYRSPTAVCYSP